MPRNPVVIWVVGDNTNVGKTTISVALIRALNSAGIATIGFKPYAGARLIDVIDLLVESAVGDALLVGRDARKLAKASPLLPADWLEVANPSWRVSHPGRDSAVLIRKGASATGSRTLLQTQSAKSLWSRPDLLRLSQRMRLSIQDFHEIPDSSADEIDFSSQHVQRVCYSRLLSLAPEYLVCEGAGRLLPVWEGAPTARHLFLVSAGSLYLFRNCDVRLSQESSPFGPYTTASIIPQLKGRSHLTSPIPLFHPADLEAGLDEFIKRFVIALI